jgi:hypothetical protein
MGNILNKSILEILRKKVGSFSKKWKLSKKSIFENEKKGKFWIFGKSPYLLFLFF